MNSVYIELKDYAKYMDVQKGDIIFLSSDSRRMLCDAMRNQADSDLNLFLDGLIKKVGKEGTIILPTYNWEFCEGKGFDYNKTKSKTGILSVIALERKDFKRTKHPIYSFAVYGKYKEELCAMENIDSFGEDSPFAFLREHNVKNYVIDVTLENCFTYVHFVEEQSGIVSYRYIKNFEGDYIDEDGICTKRVYSMFVRKLDLDVQSTVDLIEDDFIRTGIEYEIQINSSKIKCIHMGDAYDIILSDIRDNRSKKICTYKGQ